MLDLRTPFAPLCQACCQGETRVRARAFGEAETSAGPPVSSL